MQAKAGDHDLACFGWLGWVSLVRSFDALERWLGSLSSVKIGFQTPWSRVTVFGSSKPAESCDVILLAIEVRVDGKLAVALDRKPVERCFRQAE
jgi:hypothetical protein